MKFYLVGGAIRDRLLNRPVKDRDWVVTGATPQQLIELGFKPVGKDFPVFLHPDTHEEYALARTERKTSKGYHGFEFYTDPSVSLKDDLARRDLTINALAEDKEGNIIDYYQGLNDLENKLLRHVSPAFAEDPVRILRVARFAARYHHLGFTVAPNTQQLMQSMVMAGEANALVAERIWQELASALNEKNPEIFLTVLKNSQALPILFPEFDLSLANLTMFAKACQLNNDPIIRFTLMLKKLLLPKMVNNLSDSQHLYERLRLPKAYQQLAILLLSYSETIHRVESLTNEQILQLLLDTDAFRRPERFKQLLTACQLDYSSNNLLSESSYPAITFLNDVLSNCQTINIQTIVKRGFTGIAIKEELHKQYQGVIENTRSIAN